MAGNKSCRERKSVSSKVTIRNSTTLIEHSEGHPTGLLQEGRSDYETAFLQPLNIGDRKGVFISKKTQEEISEIVYVAEKHVELFSHHQGGDNRQYGHCQQRDLPLLEHGGRQRENTPLCDV